MYKVEEKKHLSDPLRVADILYSVLFMCNPSPSPYCIDNAAVRILGKTQKKMAVNCAESRPENMSAKCFTRLH